MFFMCSRCTMPIDEPRGEYDVTEHELTCPECGEVDNYRDDELPIDHLGVHMPLEEFKGACEVGMFIDDDGFGNLATETHESNREVCPSIVMDEKFETCYTHIVWYNK